MAQLRIGTSYWLDQQTDETRCPQARGRHDVDVVVIGGGITGCTAAWRFARAGLKVVLLEGRRIGRGSTAASTALLMQEPDRDFLELAARFGRSTAARIWRRSRLGVASLASTLQALGASVGLHRLPSVYFTRDEDAAARLEREALARRRAGLSGRWLSSAALRSHTGIDGAGAILTEGDAQVDPYRSCLAFARAAKAQGAVLFERSPAVAVVGSKDGVRVEHALGEIRAHWAVVATGYATPEFKPLAAHFRMMTTYVIATPPVPRAIRQGVAFDLMMWDTDRPYHYLRWTPDGRILFGGADRPLPPHHTRPAGLASKARELRKDLHDLYPALEPIGFEYAWEGLFATTPDGLPYIGPHRRYPRQLFALGYSGNGMTFGFLAADILLRAVQGRPRPDDPLFGFNRHSR